MNNNDIKMGERLKAPQTEFLWRISGSVELRVEPKSERLNGYL